MLRSAIASILAVLTAAAAVAGPESVTGLRAEVRKATGKFSDFSCITRVVTRNDGVLKKMGKKYVQQHEFNKAQTHFKVPDNLRMEGKIGLVKVQMIMTGNSRIFRIPALRITKKEDISKEGFRKQTCLDLGLLSESAWEDFNVKYIGSEQQPTGPAYIVEFVRKWENPKSYRTWIDKKTLRILKVEKRESEGELQAVFKFPEAKQVGGVIWAPTRAELYSPTGELAAVTEFSELKANTGLSSKLFE